MVGKRFLADFKKVRISGSRVTLLRADRAYVFEREDGADKLCRGNKYNDIEQFEKNK